MILRFLAVLLFSVSVGMIYDVSGHGIGSETLEAKSLGDKQVFLEITAVRVDEADADQRITLQMLDAGMREPIREVTFEIQLSKQKEILFEDRFQSDSGTLVIELVNTDDKIKIEKKSNEIFGFITGSQDVAKVSGPYFDYGGLYQFKIKIHSADSYSNQLNPPLIWNSGVSIEDITRHTINDLNFGEQKINHTSYYDLIENFHYDQLTKNITFDMAFNSDLDSINQTSVVHQEIAFSKGFGDLMVSKISATVNGVQMPENTIVIDDFYEAQRVIHLTAVKKNIIEIYNQDKIQNDRLYFVIGPAQKDLPMATTTTNGQFKIVMNARSDIRSGQELEILYKIFDVFFKNKPIKVDYDLHIVQDERILAQTQGTSNDEAAKFDSITLDIPKKLTGIIYAKFENLASNPSASAKLPIVINRIASDAETIPTWIKNNADLWHNQKISDQEFIYAMQYLSKNGIISIPASDSVNVDGVTLEWIKNNADLWHNQKISDQEFISIGEYLIAAEIITS